MLLPNGRVAMQPLERQLQRRCCKLQVAIMRCAARRCKALFCDACCCASGLPALRSRLLACFGRFLAGTHRFGPRLRLPWRMRSGGSATFLIHSNSELSNTFPSSRQNRAAVHHLLSMQALRDAYANSIYARAFIVIGGMRLWWAWKVRLSLARSSPPWSG